MENSWSNGQWIIKWLDIDYVEILGPCDQKCRMPGGDLESILSGVCAAYSEGRRQDKEDNP
tara:strand:- start:274 stop:456 length:183 start_codon:yes stop_codon:yes gene_type:complete